MRTETQRAYMAGFMDGEGHIGIGLIANSHGMGRHELVVTITNTHIPSLEALAEIWDGRVLGYRKRCDGWSRTADLRWASKNAVAMLREIRPYLITKAAQADIALVFAETINPDAHRTRTITRETWEYRQQLRERLHTLNSKRPGVPAVYSEKPVMICQYCGAEFDSYQKLRKYCSRKCNMAAGRDAYVDRHTYQKECPACGRTFTARLKQQYCSISCGRKMQAPPVPKGTRRANTQTPNGI